MGFAPSGMKGDKSPEKVVIKMGKKMALGRNGRNMERIPMKALSKMVVIIK